jgi:hypothetical protein
MPQFNLGKNKWNRETVRKGELNMTNKNKVQMKIIKLQKFTLMKDDLYFILVQHCDTEIIKNA